MGKRKRPPKNQRNKNASGSKNGYDEIKRENKFFEKYYKAQGIVPENEWSAFMTSLQGNLPVSFRITGSKSQAKALLKILRTEYLDKLVTVTEDGEAEEKAICLPWYPDGLAWQLNFSRKCIRKSETFTQLHSCLVYETNSGNISRQETVSMIPPLVLDVQPHHYVLDMCAAPGSKTAQLIEMLQATNVIPDGMLVANDIDNQRCYMLVHQAKRLHSPCCIITNHDASVMPQLRRKTQEPGEVCNLKYDRILCDVPCSGDGTLRKNYDVWLKWNAANGNNLHSVQSRIAKRGLELLAVGGKMVYSTCSLNPIEDEAVVHNVLVQCGGSAELVDVSDALPGLISTKGLSHWKVMSRDLQEFQSFDEVPERHRTQIRQQMFPPSQEDAEKFHLNRCMRILPHHQNTGGFFVAVFVKVSLLPGEKPNLPTVLDSMKSDDSSVEASCAAETSSLPPNGDNTSVLSEVVESTSSRSLSPPRKKSKLFGVHKEDPFIFFKDDEEVWPPIRDYYGIDTSFNSAHLLTRCQTGKKRNIYFVSKAVKDVLTCNSGRLKLINTGVKVFCRNDNKGASCNFRLTQEGLQTVIPFLSLRRVTITQSDLVLLLTTDFPYNAKMAIETKKQLQQLESGCVALCYKLPTTDGDTLDLFLVGWKGANSTRAYVPKSDRIHYLRLCGVDISKYDRSNYKKGRGSGSAANDEGPCGEEKDKEEQEDEDIPEGDGVNMDEEEAAVLEDGDCSGNLNQETSLQVDQPSAPSS